MGAGDSAAVTFVVDVAHVDDIVIAAVNCS